MYYVIFELNFMLFIVVEGIKLKKLVGYKQKRVIKKGRKLEEGGLDCSNFRYLVLLIRRLGNLRVFFYRIFDQNRLSSFN